MSGHHISSYKLLLTVTAALFALTVATVGVYYLALPQPWSIIVAMFVAIVKASLVALFFMNLYWDTRFNLMLFLASILFFILLVGFTLLDTLTREPLVPSF